MKVSTTCKTPVSPTSIPDVSMCETRTYNFDDILANIDTIVWIGEEKANWVIIFDNMEELLSLAANPADMLKEVYDTNDNGRVDDADKVNGLTVETSVPVDAVFTDTTYPEITPTVGGLLSNTDAVKFAGIETGATADLTGAEIKALYEVLPSAFTNALFTKLGLIEDSATADQTAAEIKSLYESNPDTNVFLDAEKTLLALQSGTNTGDQDLSTYFKNDDVVMVTNPFGGRGLYISSLYNTLFRAESRWTVTANLYNKIDDSFDSTLTTEALIFNGSYDDALQIPAGKYVIISIDFNGLFGGYPYGDVFLSHYHDSHTESAKLRVYTEYEPHGIGWHEYDFVDFVNEPYAQILKAHNPIYGITHLELIVVAPDTELTKLTQVDFKLDRPASKEMPMFDKFRENTLYNNINMNNYDLINVNDVKADTIKNKASTKVATTDAIIDGIEKLTGIEAGATGDQTNSEIKAGYEANANTNEFSDSEKSKLAALESSHFKGQYISLVALETAYPTASIGDYANVDLGVGEDVLRYVWDNDDTSWIQQLGSSNILSDAEIKTQYENNANTNEFSDSEQQSIIDHETLIGINAQAIANLATAQGIVTGVQTAGYVHEPMPAVWTQMAFDTTTPSTDTDVFEIDDVANTITFKINASFNCNNAIAVESVTPSEVTLQCRIVNVADDSVLITRDAVITLPNGTVSYLDVLELLTIGRNGMPSAPVTLRMEVREVTASYNMISFRSVVTSSSSYDVSTSHEGLSGRDVADSHPMSAITGLLTNLPEPVFPQDEGLPLVAKSTGAVYEEILGLPDETDQSGKSVTNTGSKKTSFWSFVNCNPNVMDEDQTIPDGVSASVVDGFTIEDDITLTVPDGSVLAIV